MNFDKLLSQYDYKFPKELIAQEPARPRDSARLMVYNRRSGQVIFDVFTNIAKYLPKNAVLVFNQTKVVPARLAVTKQTGGKAEILYISDDKQFIKALANRKLTIGSKLSIKFKPFFQVIRQQEQFYFLKPLFPISKLPTILNKFGQTPLPPYIKHPGLREKQLRKEYQSVFAKTGLSVAAPTACLHFTKELINKLKKQGIGVEFITLNVNLGTFAPLKRENIKNQTLHTENYEINKATAARLNKAKRQGRPIIAVGTTVVRTLESAAQKRQLTKLCGPTNLFIREHYNMQIADGIITNFHVPKSSLLMLVSALTGRKTLLGLYQKAIQKKFRLFSFGDGMLII
jgi:S-adenosylmethionine:tRNA ribosyltransferase-isomerase